MSFDFWLAFAAASMALLLIPGPTVLLVLSYALSKGRSVAIASAAGVAVGDFIAMTASFRSRSFGSCLRYGVYGAQVDRCRVSGLAGHQDDPFGTDKRTCARTRRDDERRVRPCRSSDSAQPEINRLFYCLCAAIHSAAGSAAAGPLASCRRKTECACVGHARGRCHAYRHGTAYRHPASRPLTYREIS